MSRFTTLTKLIQFTSVLTLTSVLGIAACTYRLDKNAGNGGDGAPGEKITRLPGFDELRTSFLNAKCMTCHDGGQATDLRSYTQFKENLSEARALVASGRMPKKPAPPLSSEEFSLLVSWMDAGAPENGMDLAEPTPGAPASPTASPTPAPPATPGATPAPAPSPAIGFTRVVSEVLKPRCAKCHFSDDTDFDSGAYASVSTLKNAIRSRTTAPLSNRRHMPPANEPQLTPDELKLLTDWIDAGAPN